MSLSDVKIRNAKPKARQYKLADGEGMFLLVHPNGSKYWRLKYYFQGRERILALGKYPEVDLAEARERRLYAKKELNAGNDPGVLKQTVKRLEALKSENDFKSIALEWHDKRKHKWSLRTAKIILHRLEMHVFPRLGPRPIAKIDASEILEMLRIIEARGTLDTAHRVMQIATQIFNYAVATRRAENNPVPSLRGALKTPAVKHHAHLKAEQLPEFLKTLESYDGEELTKLALKLLILTFVRTTELRGAKWPEFNLDKAEWRIPPERMKGKIPHIVPLSNQALSLLMELKKISGKKEYVFPNEHNLETFMSENTMLYALYRMGYRSRVTGHGFRSTASTILNENGFMPDLIERQLAHIEPNQVRGAYNHAQYLPDRRNMMQWWADYLDKPPTGNESAQ
jgi:integrase